MDVKQKADGGQSSDELILGHLYLVEHIVNKIMPRLFMYIERDDLVGYGMLGLVRAARVYETRRGVKFISYAYQRIYGSIMDGLRLFDWLPRTLYKKRGEYKLHSSEEICGDTKIFDFRNFCPLDRLIEIEGRELIHGEIAKLPERKRLIVEMHYYGDMKFIDIAKKLKLTTSRVSQLHRGSLLALKDVVSMTN